MKNTVIAFVSLLIIGGGAFLTPAAAHADCLSLSRDLARGSKGADVSELQRFLVSRNYPGGGSWMITGTFGKATETAVRNFQRESRIAATGRVDLATRLALDSASCAGVTITPTLPTPTFGLPTVPTPSLVPPVFTTPVTNLVSPVSSCSLVGTYAGTEIGATCPCIAGMYGSACSVGAPSISGFNKISGGVGESITIYGSGFSRAGNAVRFGNAVIPNITSIDGRAISFTVPATLSGFGAQPLQIGTYEVAVANAYGQYSNAIPFSVSSLVNGATGAASISATGPTALQAGVQGSWNVLVNNQTGISMTVTANWGDSTSGSANVSTQTASIQGSQLLTFTHAFSQAGTYTIQFTANNNQGIIQTSNFTVVVTGNTSTTNTNSISITSVSPTGGRPGSQIIITGSGFTNYDNVVHFGAGGSRFVIASGNTITYTIPYAVSSCDVSASGCTSPSVAVVAGSYPLYITNGNGISNTVFVNVQ